MDDRKRIIRDLEDKKLENTGALGKLLEGLGETLLQRIGEEEPFTETGESSFGGILAEYRRLQKEINESYAIIKTLEADTLRLKELEGEILAKEEEHSRLEKDFREVCTRLGELLLAANGQQSDSAGFDEFANPYRLEEGFLLAKISEQEQKLRELEEREGGMLTWLSKNAQIVMARAHLSKDRSTLQRVYNKTGEQFIAAGLQLKAGELPEGEHTGAAGKVAETAANLKGSISSLAVYLAGLKGERRNMGDLLDTEGSPFRRIQGLEKHIVHIQGTFPAVYYRFGVLAAEVLRQSPPAQQSAGNVYLASIIKEDDTRIFEKAAVIRTQITEEDLEIEKIRAAISIDNEKAEIEKMKKSITNQQQKIAAANDAIADLEKQITESQRRIEDFETFLAKHN